MSLAGTKEYYSHTVVSTNHGASWQIGGVVGPKCNECQAVELSDGAVLLNMRSYRKNNQRLVAVSRDGGLSFSEPKEDPALIEPVCQASILRYSPGEVLFSNPASKKREKMTVRLSYDDCRTWPVAKELWPGRAAYSCLTLLPDKSVGCFYERGVTNANETIVLARFTLEWLTDGKDK
jgi:sialidase-1